MAKEELTFSNIRTCPFCNSQNIRTEYEPRTDIYTVYCIRCGRMEKVKGE